MPPCSDAHHRHGGLGGEKSGRLSAGGGLDAGSAHAAAAEEPCACSEHGPGVFPRLLQTMACGASDAELFFFFFFVGVFIHWLFLTVG